MTHDVFYLLGALRDASVDIREGKNYEIKFGQKNQEWLVGVHKKIQNHFRIDGCLHKNLLRYTNFVIQFCQISEMQSPQTEWNTPSCMLSSSHEEVIAYIQGFWDAEGGLPKIPERAEQKYISFDQKNKEVLMFIRNALIEMGFMPTNLTFTGNVWQFRLTRKNNMIRFFHEIGSQHPEKFDRLRRMIATLTP